MNAFTTDTVNVLAIPLLKLAYIDFYFRMAMDLWLSTSTLDTWAHGQSLIPGSKEFILSDLNMQSNFHGEISPLVTLRDGEAMMETALSQRICQDMVISLPTNFLPSFGLKSVKLNCHPGGEEHCQDYHRDRRANRDQRAEGH